MEYQSRRGKIPTTPDAQRVRAERYNTGNICGATLNGERISNSEAKRILGRLLDCKVYYDLTDNKWYTQYSRGDNTAQEMLNTVVSNIKAFIADKEKELA